MGEEPREIEVLQRRFRCRECRAVMVVAPAHVLRCRMFSSVAIVWALALHGVERLSAVRVRQVINPWRVVGATSAQGWRSLGKWAQAAASRALLPGKRAVSGTARQVAAAVSWGLSALAPPTFHSQSVAHQAVAGTLHALMGITP